MPIAEKTILAEAIRKALEPVAEKYRLKLSLEDKTEDGLAWKLSFSAPEGKEPAEDRIRRHDQKAYWENYTKFFSELEPEDFGKVVRLNGIPMLICGIESNGPGKEESVHLRSGNGVRYKAGAVDVLHALGRKTKAEKEAQVEAINAAAKALGLGARFGAILHYGREEYILEGIDPDEAKLPIIARSLKTNKRYKLPLEAGS